MATQLMAKKSLLRTNREIREDYRPTDDEPFHVPVVSALISAASSSHGVMRSCARRRRDRGSICTRNLHGSNLTLQIERAGRLSVGWNFARVIVSVS